MANKNRNLYSFEKGLGFVPIMHQTKIRGEIMDILHIKNDASWISYKKGRMKIEHEAYVKIEQLFFEYGVEKKNIWGLAPDKNKK